MKVVILALFLLACMVSMIQGGCLGRPKTPSCDEVLDEGHDVEGGYAHRMWFFNAESGLCEQMHYKGAGGNNNRWCSKGDCDHHCKA
ncbi:kunitz-type serine protease inhibitor conotoxin Cal9.1c-like [Stomoxys calcitrans]|uniref:BPTI/Kunitz inhibitor domain-containing protein n=1 Tax=Stomoxys calcitrans TaxID=35570 RepID=A0A1I8NW10_STOCA|nr:kunitz-type serine protease inhibitor conotoxin Cal9.1c-like [Stomoxys calcitrans]